MAERSTNSAEDPGAGDPARVLLFDVDGTLVDTGGAGRRAMSDAFTELFGVPAPFKGQAFTGRTDPEILSIACRRHLGREPTPAEYALFRSSYLERLRYEVLHASRYRVLPGVSALLEGLSRRPDCILGLCTGNLEEGAKIKLSRAGLDRYFCFGGFGSDSGDRVQLTRIAVRRAMALAGGRPVRPTVIGDSPFDHQAGTAAGCRVVLVGTGWTNSGVLRSLAPDAFLESLADTHAAASALLESKAPLVVDVEQVDRAIDLVKRGGILVYPTSTLYGLGCDATNPEAVQRARRVKGSDQPFIVLVRSLRHAMELAPNMPEVAQKLAVEHWPGPLTLVVKAPTLARLVGADDGTVGFRHDPHPFVQRLLEGTDRPVVSTSANLSGGQAPRSYAVLDSRLQVAVDLIVKDTSPCLGQPSTVVRVDNGDVRVLRRGAVEIRCP